MLSENRPKTSYAGDSSISLLTTTIPTWEVVCLPPHTPQRCTVSTRAPAAWPLSPSQVPGNCRTLRALVSELPYTPIKLWPVKIQTVVEGISNGYIKCARRLWELAS